MIFLKQNFKNVFNAFSLGLIIEETVHVYIVNFAASNDTRKGNVYAHRTVMRCKYASHCPHLTLNPRNGLTMNIFQLGGGSKQFSMPVRSWRQLQGPRLQIPTPKNPH